MKLKSLLPLTLLSAAVSANADQLQSVTEFDYSRVKYGSIKADVFTLGSTYYFAPRETLGPLKELEYINKTSNVFGGYVYEDYDLGGYRYLLGGYEHGSRDTAIIGGEYFAGNVLVGASYENTDDADTFEASLGYLFAPNFLVRVDAEKTDGQSTDFYASAQYTHHLSGADYLGFTVRVDDDFDSRELSSKYFAEVGNGSYIALTADYANISGGDNFWAGAAEFYFNKFTSVGASYDKNDDYELSFNHFFNEQIAGKLAYSSNSDDSRLKVWSLGIRAQF